MIPHLKPDLLTKFSLVAFLLTLAIAAGLGWSIQQQMEENALRQAAQSAADQVTTILDRNLQQEDLAGGLNKERFAEIDSLIRQNVLKERIVRVKIWNKDGLLIYSDEKDLVGKRFQVDEDLKEALAGEIDMDISSLEKEENLNERRNFTRLIEVYVPLEPANSSSIEGAYEIYKDISFLEPNIAQMRRSVWGNVGLGFLILYGSLFALVRSASRELTHRNEENERLYKEAKQRLVERMRAENALKESEERLRLQIERMPIGCIVWSSDFRVVSWNPAAEEIFGYKADEVLGRHPYGLIVPKDAQPQVDTIWHRLLEGDATANSVNENTTKDGRIIICSWSNTPLKKADGPVIGVLSMIQDITERKRAEEIRQENERLSYASRAKSEFLASMSHELRTPLNSIIGFSELLKQKTFGGLAEKQEHYVDNVITSSKFLLDLINDVLDLSKVEAGKIELVIEKISLPETLNETVILIKERAAKHNVLIKKEFDPEVDFIQADRQRLKQVLFNLLSNAVKFSKPEGGTVTTTVKKVKDMAQISVSDTGIGIGEEDLGKLFKEFGQANPEISKKYGGTGLGLAISKKLIGLHGGKIWVESKYGEGSTFTFSLPITAKTGESE